MKKLGKALGAVAVVGALAAGGSAFTAANSAPGSATAGYSTTSADNVTVNSIAYVTDSTGADIDGVNLVLDTDTTAHTVQVALNGSDAVTCVAGTPTVGPVTTPYTCDTSSLGITTLALTDTHVVAIN